MRLFESIKPLFQNKPLLIVVNKVDVLRLDELPGEKRNIIKQLEDDENISVIEMSTVTDFGVMDVKTQACEKLLAFRVDQKMKTKKVISQYSFRFYSPILILKFPNYHRSNQVEGLLNRLHVAMPQPRDGISRPPCIPESVLQKKLLGAAKKAAKNKKLERDIELEMGDDYVLDLKKSYDIEGDQKYDIIPEFWEGHNIADYIDPEIFEVRILHILLPR